MKKDLLIGGTFVLLAALSIGVVALILGSQPEEENAHKTIKSKPEPIAALPVVKEEPKKNVEPIRRTPLKQQRSTREEPRTVIAKKTVSTKEEPSIVAKLDPKTEEPKTEEPKIVAKLDPKKEEKPLPDIKKIEVKADPPKEEKKQPLIEANPDLIEIGDDLKKLNRPNGEYTVRQLEGEDRLTLVGKVKTLRLHGMQGKAILDASQLHAQEIIISGTVAGSSVLKLFAPQGSVVFQAPINGSATVEIEAPDGKVVLKSAGPIIATGGTKLTIAAKEVELNGEVLGGVAITVILSKDGSLKFTKISEGVHLHYSKANRSDPEPRIVQGNIVGGARLKKIESANR